MLHCETVHPIKGSMMNTRYFYHVRIVKQKLVLKRNLIYLDKLFVISSMFHPMCEKFEHTFIDTASYISSVLSRNFKDAFSTLQD